MFTRLQNMIRNFSVMERRLFFTALGLIGVAALFLGINLFYENTKAVPVISGEYIEGMAGQPVLINPTLLGGNEIDRDLTELLWKGLLFFAEEYKPNEDGLSWTVILKKDLKWSDGEPFTSDDVIFTLETIQDLGSRSSLFLTWQSVVAERMSEREIRFTLKTPYAFFAGNLAELKIIPQHIFGSIPSANLRLSSFNLEPVGNGPYSFQKYDKRKDGFITDYYLQTNPYFAGNPPYIENFRVKFFSNLNEVIAAFNRLEISGFGGSGFPETTQIKAGFTPYVFDMSRYYAVFLNQGTHNGLLDPAVRQALTLASNKADIAGTLFPGLAKKIDGPILPIIEGFDPSIYEKELFSIEEAQKTLDTAGWVLGDSGVREKTSGKLKTLLEFNLVVPQIPALKLVEAANILKEDWAKIGVKVTIIPMNTEDINKIAIGTRNYHMILFGNVLKNNPDIFAFWHSSERTFPGLNLAIYGNRKVDSLLETIRKDSNPESRLTNLFKLQSLILADYPAVFLFSLNYLYVSSNNVYGIKPFPITTNADRFENVTEWYLKTKRVFQSSS